jgi:GNAT superfamily N-acetyltransferase
MQIQLAENDEQIARCFLVMAQLREQLTIGEFLERVLRQRRNGYQLAFLEADGEVQSVAGFRLMENLAWGRFLYVDDLVTAEQSRSRGFGDALFDWLVDYAKQHNCRQFHLDSGVQRFGAHAFYLRKKMIISSHHFAMTL